MAKSLIFLLLITGCGSLQKPKDIYNNSVDFSAYTNAYKEYKLEHLGTKEVGYVINVRYSHLESPTVGLCVRPSIHSLPRIIKIDPTYWEKADDETRLNLIFHELGHCDLNCEHQEEVDGLMNEKIKRTRSSNNRIQQLFLECK